MEREYAIESQRGVTPPCPYPGRLVGPCWAAPCITKGHMNLRSPYNVTQLDLAVYCSLAFNLTGGGGQVFLAVVHWAVFGFCEPLKKFLSILSDIKIFFFPDKTEQKINTQTSVLMSDLPCSVNHCSHCWYAETQDQGLLPGSCCGWK